MSRSHLRSWSSDVSSIAQQHRIGVGLLLLGVFLTAGQATAQPLFPGTISPQPASTASAPTATLAVPGCQVSGPRHTGSELSRSGDTLQLTVQVPASFACFAAGDPETEVAVDFDLLRLEAGTYTLEHWRQTGDVPPVLLETLTFEVLDERCALSARPGATLVVPYFEVDLASPEGATTAVAVSNADDEPVVARVTLWSDWGIAVLGFDIYLDANGTQTFNLRQILEGGVLPITGHDLDPGVFEGCSAPLELPTLDAQETARLRTRLSGLPDPNDGFCYGWDRGTGTAVGFLTVDALNGCSSVIQFPGAVGYFEAGGTGLASNRNVLWGDVIHVDPDANAAQATRALSLPATDLESIPAGALGPTPTFYGFAGNDRHPLPTRYRTRYLNGGDFEGGGRLQIFSPFFRGLAGRTCNSPPAVGILMVASLDESGGPLGDSESLLLETATRTYDTADPALGFTSPFGLADLHFFTYPSPLPLTPPSRPTQGLASSMLTAGDRFSVGLEAVPTENLCP